MLGTTLWNALLCVANNEIMSSEYNTLYPTLMGDHPQAALTEGLPAAPVLAVLAYGLRGSAGHQLSLPSSDDIVQWAGRPILDLLADAKTVFQRLVQSKLWVSSQRRSDLLAQAWQGVVTHGMTDWSQLSTAHQKEFSQRKDSLNRLVREMLINPILGPVLWSDKGWEIWIGAIKQHGQTLLPLKPDVQQWWFAQPDRWTLLGDQGSLHPGTHFQNALKMMANDWLNYGDRPRPTDLAAGPLVGWLAAQLPEQLAQIRHDTGERPLPALTRRNRART